MSNSKKILLVHPLGYTSEKASGDISRIANLTPPIGIASICAYLLERQIQCDIIDCYAHPDADIKIIQYIKSQAPDFIGFSCSTSTFLDGIRLAKIAKCIYTLTTTASTAFLHFIVIKPV